MSIGRVTLTEVYVSIGGDSRLVTTGRGRRVVLSSRRALSGFWTVNGKKCWLKAASKSSPEWNQTVRWVPSVWLDICVHVYTW